MSAMLEEALDAGAAGFTTSLSDHHETPDGRPVASRSSSWEELTALVRLARGAVFELATDTGRTEATDLPSGAPRIRQGASGFRATIVGGEETLSSAEPTGALSGRLLRRTRSHRTPG